MSYTHSLKHVSQTEHRFCLQLKLEVIKAMEEPGASFASVAEQFGVVSNTVRIIRTKDSIKDPTALGKRKRLRDGKQNTTSLGQPIKRGIINPRSAKGSSQRPSAKGGKPPPFTFSKI